MSDPARRPPSQDRGRGRGNHGGDYGRAREGDRPGSGNGNGRQRNDGAVSSDAVRGRGRGGGHRGSGRGGGGGVVPNNGRSYNSGTDRRQDWWSDSADAGLSSGVRAISISSGSRGGSWRRDDHQPRQAQSRGPPPPRSDDSSVDVSRYRLISKLEHGDTSGDNLKLRSEQEKLFAHIKTKITAKDRAADILLLFRKLREGITATATMDGFTADVYTEAAWFAFGANDLAEFHVCLVALATRIHPSLRPPREKDWAVCLSHLILYFACCVPGGMYEVFRMLRKTPVAQQESTPVRDALRVAAAIDVADYFTFETLRQRASGKNRALMDRARSRVQLQALDIIRKAYITLDLEYLACSILGFDSAEACIKFIEEHFVLPAAASGPDSKTIGFKEWKVKS